MPFALVDFDSERRHGKRSDLTFVDPVQDFLPCADIWNNPGQDDEQLQPPNYESQVTFVRADVAVFGNDRAHSLAESSPSRGK